MGGKNENHHGSTKTGGGGTSTTATTVNSIAVSAARMATQEQLRLARMTQDGNHKEENEAHIMKLVKKVTEATRCSQFTAEIALFDADNDVSGAIVSILEQTGADDWQESKSRKARKHSDNQEEELENHPKSERRHRGGRGSSMTEREGKARNNRQGPGGRMGANRENREGTEENRRSDESKGSHWRSGRGKPNVDFRGGRGAHRGNRSRGSKSGAMSSIGTWNENSGSGNTWDNTMAVEGAEKTEKDMMWRNSMASTVQNGSEDWNGDDGMNGEETDWKNMKTPLVFETRRKEEKVSVEKGVSAEQSTTPSYSSVARMSKPTPPVVIESITTPPPPAQIRPPSQSQTQRSSNHRSSESHSSTGPQAQPEFQQQRSTGAENPIVSKLMNVQSQPAPPTDSFRQSSTTSDWTQKLKNDLGIGQNSQVSSNVHHQPRQSTVEFVSEDGRGPSATALPEYQFGFHHIESTPSNDQVLFPSPTKNEVSSAVNGSLSKENTVQIASGLQPNNYINPALAVAQAHPKGLGSAAPNLGLSYAETTTMSYTTDANRGNNYSINQVPLTNASVTATFASSTNKPFCSSASKPAANNQFGGQQQLYNTASMAPIAAYTNQFPYMNMYSPVNAATLTRPDDALQQHNQQQLAAALLQQQYFPGPFDFSGLASIPPVNTQQSLRSENSATQNFVGDFKPSYYPRTSETGNASSTVASNVAPPPGFSGPPAPANVAAAAQAQAAFQFPQQNLASLFTLPPAYPPQPHLQPFMLPNISASGPNALGMQQKLTQQPLFQQSSAFDEQQQATLPNQPSQSGGGQTANLGGSSQLSKGTQEFSRMQSYGQNNKAAYGSGDKNLYPKAAFDRSSFNQTATGTPPPLPSALAGSNLTAFPGAAINPSGPFTAFQAGANTFVPQLSPMALGQHLHDNRSAGGQAVNKHASGLQPQKYTQQGGYGGNWN